MKYCPGCQSTKDEIYFSKRSDKPWLFRSRCKACYAAAANARYHLDDGKTARERNATKRGINQRYVYDYLSTHPCVDCGESNWVVLEFDHVRGDKWRNICDIMLMEPELVISEIAKCDSVCANCHKIRTYTRAGSWRVNYR